MVPLNSSFCSAALGSFGSSSKKPAVSLKATKSVTEFYYSVWKFYLFVVREFYMPASDLVSDLVPEAGTKGFEDGLWESTPHPAKQRWSHSFQGTSCACVSL